MTGLVQEDVKQGACDRILPGYSGWSFVFGSIIEYFGNEFVAYGYFVIAIPRIHDTVTTH